MEAQYISDSLDLLQAGFAAVAFASFFLGVGSLLVATTHDKETYEDLRDRERCMTWFKWCAIACVICAIALSGVMKMQGHW